MIQREHQMNNGFSTEEDSRGPLDQICCLFDDGERCRRSAGNASYSKRIQKTVAQRRLKLSSDNMARHSYICDHHKSMIQCARNKQRRRKESEDDSNETDTDLPDVDLYQLQVHTLRRYRKHFKIASRPGWNKSQLADVFLMHCNTCIRTKENHQREYYFHHEYSHTIQKHFKSLPVNEKEIIAYFIYTVKTNGNTLDQKNGLNSDTI